MSAPEGIVVEKFKDFVDLRKTGVTREEAWQKVLNTVRDFDQQQIGSLLILAKEWEKREGYKYRQQTGLNMTILEPEPTVSSVGSAIRRISPIPKPQSSEATAGMLPVREDAAQQAKSYFDENSTLLLYIRNQPLPLQVKVHPDKELIIGRLTINNPMKPDIDLEKFMGSQYGVSRIHASIQRRDNTLMVSDLGSRNFTLVNTERLYPQELRVLNDGDELCFGSMQITVRFHHGGDQPDSSRE